MIFSSSSTPSFFQDTCPTSGIYTLSSDLPFLEILAKSLLHFTKKSPLDLSTYTLLFPTQRSLRTFKQILGGHTKALFLPNLFTLNDLAPRTEDFLTCLFQNIPYNLLESLSSPSPLSLLRGRLLCSEVLRRSTSLFNDSLSSQNFENLSKALLETLGELASHNISLKDGDLHIPETYGLHWSKTTLFLKTISEIWPVILKAEDASDPLTFVQNRLKILSDYLLKSPPTTPLIVVGIRGLSPIFIPFLKTISKGSNGLFLIETFSNDLQNIDSKLLSPSSPAYEIISFLSHLNIPDLTLKPWPFVYNNKNSTLTSRLSLINETFFPALTPKERPHDLLVPLDKSLEDVSFFEANSLLEEARLIALRMRHVLETPQKTAALITPDRKLAHLVKTELLKWNIIVDDSGGTSFSQTSVGRYFLTSLQTLLSEESPLLLISLLKHPFTRLRKLPEDLNNILETLEHYGLRGFKLPPGISSLLHRLISLKKEEGDPLNKELQKAIDLLKTFDKMCAPFKHLLEKGAPPSLLLKAHEEFLKGLSMTAEDHSLLWQKEDEKEAEPLFQTFLQETQSLSPLTGFSYNVFLKNLFDNCPLQLTLPEHPRLSILGLFESRLLKKDSVILGSLNDGTWPDLPSTNPWIHKHLREALSLPPLETRIGISIQDFLHGFLNKEVLLTRSKRTSQGIERPSRILVHLTSFLECQNISFSPPVEASFLKVLDNPPLRQSLSAPSPCPPISIRPRCLSPSMIEMLLKDPYGFYSQTILNLKPLKAFEASPTSSDFGTIIHNVIEDLSVQSFFEPEKILSDFKKTSFYKALSEGEKYFWSHRFINILKNFWTHHETRLQNPELLNISREVKVAISYDLATSSDSHLFWIKGRIDRLEETSENFHIIDYKTGILPTKDDIEEGISPQLPLLGLLLKEAFISQNQPLKNIKLSYWPLKKEGERSLNTLKNPEILMENTQHLLRELLGFFYNSECPQAFQAKPCAHSPYAYLARTQEWGGPLEALSENFRESTLGD